MIDWRLVFFISGEWTLFYLSSLWYY